MSDLTSLCVEHLYNTYPLTLKGQKTILIDGVVLRRVEDYLTPPLLKDTDVVEFAFMPDKDRRVTANKIQESLLQKLTQIKDNLASELASKDLDIVENLIPLVGDNGNIYFFCQKRRFIVDITKNALIAALGRCKYDKWVSDTKELVQVTYTPNEDEQYTGLFCDLNPERNSLSCVKRNLNIYKPPFWREYNLINTTMPPILEKFFNYFAPLEDARHYLLSWLRTAVFSKNGTMLVLIGTKGSGKGILSELLKSVVGSSNYGSAQRGFLRSDFNKLLLGKQVIVIDEIRATKEGIEKLKSYTNDAQNIEAKGVDADVEHQIHANFLYTNNNPDHFHLTQDDRRFSILDITKHPIKKYFKEDSKDFGKLLKYEVINNKELISQFASFLYNYDTKDFDSFTPYKGAMFDKAVMLSLNTWQQKLHTTLTSKTRSKYLYEDLFPELDNTYNKNRPRSLERVKTFVSNYYYKDLPIAKFHYETFEGNQEIYLVPNKYLLPIADDLI